MTNQQGTINQSQKPVEGYRGALVYQQEYGYKLITMMVSLLTPNERSTVTTCDCGFTFTEEAEHIPSGPLLAAVDFYHFAVTEGTEIELMMRSPWGEDHARYIVSATDIQEHSPFLWLDVIKSSQSDKTIRLSDER
ncbi:MAG TPA: hypothetical protein VGL94_21300 [Ktedonobacteraceae bacterium]|jgi:hypothetical protein